MSNPITLKLSDSVNSIVYDLLEVPLAQIPIRGATDIETIDGNISTYFTYNKRSWKHKWAYMSETDYLALKAFYDRQFSTFRYPLLTIPRLGVEDIPVVMNINQQNIVNNCGTVSSVEVTFRETRQLSIEAN